MDEPTSPYTRMTPLNAPNMSWSARLALRGAYLGWHEFGPHREDAMSFAWFVYPGDYAKEWYDVEFDDGTTATAVWPNAGCFDDRPESEVKHVRFSRHVEQFANHANAPWIVPPETP